VYFMLTACGPPQGEEEGPAHVDACGLEREGVKNLMDGLLSRSPLSRPSSGLEEVL